ncbi:hypothetical protein IJV57_02050 [Candidatus Saccharibacteria bacterium]|nr:hypothetical protein [Candidatus Saccharibacteria bacterium]
MFKNIRLFKLRKPVLFGIDNSDRVAKLVYQINGGVRGYANFRTPHGIPCLSSVFEESCEVVDLAELGFVRAYEKGRRVVIEKNLSVTPPEDVESYLVNTKLGLIAPEYYGADPERSYRCVHTPFGDIADHYSKKCEECQCCIDSGEGCDPEKESRYYVGDLVVCGGVDAKMRIFKKVGEMGY